MFSLILPVYNERENLSKNIEKIIDGLSGIKERYEIIIAEDGSTDGTCPIAKSLSRRYDNVKISHSDSRLGKGQAIKRALSLARGDKIAYMDIDLSPDIACLEDIIRYLDRYEIVIGSRLIKRNMARRSRIRYPLSISYNLIIRILFRSAVRDHQCGFKAFRREVILGLAGQTRNNRWFFDTEILIKAQDQGYRIKEFPINWSESPSTRMRVSLVIFQMLADIVAFLLHKRNIQRQE
jgi:glycosyltransferase involved in cell wall biosynthesis